MRGAPRASIAEVLGDEAAAATRILYGGSVKAANIAGFMREPDVDGALVGGASLQLDEFASIVRFQKHVGNLSTLDVPAYTDRSAVRPHSKGFIRGRFSRSSCRWCSASRASC